MKRYAWQIALASCLAVLSAGVYLLHYALFRDARHIFLYLVGDIAFLPVQVLFVTLIVDRLLNRREKLAMLKKMNMVIGVFFSEAGAALLRDLNAFHAGGGVPARELLVTEGWSDRDFAEAARRFRGRGPEIECRAGDLAGLKAFLAEKRMFLVSLLENPNLLEHETFTDLLWAVFHLAEELAARERVDCLPESDAAHLAGDIRRAYGLLVTEWLSYMRHLKRDYPYLFSLAARMNPFDPAASPAVR
ncbi:MAG: hypothetical protein ACM3NF_10170 [Gemmatimonadota bacterium]